jgi:hypothetical protein
VKRIALACSLLVAVAGAADVAWGVQRSSRARLRSFVCKHAIHPASRAISVTAVMRPLPQTRRMWLKFELVRKSKRTGLATRQTGGDLGKWIAPADPSLGTRPGDVWVFKHPVKDLMAPDTYRFRVSFRWTGSHGRRLGDRVRHSRSCFQPELRPDLLVASIQVSAIPGQANNDRYVARIRNAGATAAKGFQVQFSYGDIRITRAVKRLKPRSSIKESFVGPRCTATTAPTVTVDPGHHIDDANPSNNSRVANCS